ncbi:MAG: type II secretion system F family protein, partial [Mycobacterium sp.]
MTGPVVAALGLSLALVVLPSSPRRRLVSPGAAGPRIPRPTGGWAVVCATVAGFVVTVVLPPATILAA